MTNIHNSLAEEKFTSVSVRAWLVSLSLITELQPQLHFADYFEPASTLVPFE